jgi:hypothetical protein
MAMRPMTMKEATAAFNVFQGSLQFSEIRVQDDEGLGGSPWTSPPSWSCPYYVLHVGETLYQDMAKNHNRKTIMIHELAHVWQGRHGVPLGYVVNSAFHQSIAAILNGGQVAKAYQYTLGLKWRQYNCEQQATIVNHWFGAGSSNTDPRYVYIAANIRPGNPWA